MNIDFEGSLKTIDELAAGDLFVMRDNTRRMFGIRATYGAEPAAVILNMAIKEADPFPCVATGHFLGEQALIHLAKAVLVPDFSEAGLDFRSEVADGPGTLFFSPDRICMRVARRREGFFYVDLKSGEVSSSRPGGIEVPAVVDQVAKQGQ